jgi:hypothetical protein
MKICPMGVEVFHADEQRDMTKLIIAIRNFSTRVNRERWREETRKAPLSS